MSELDIINARNVLDAKIARANARLAALPRAPIAPDACPTCGGLGEVFTGRYEPCPACVCPVCGNQGYVRYDVPIGHPAFGKLHPCPANCRTIQEHRARRQDAVRKGAVLPKGYAGCTFDTFDALPPELREGKQLAREFAEAWARLIPEGGWVEYRGELRNSLVFSGLHGRGKTGLAASALNYLIGTGQPCLYIRLQDGVKAVQKRYGKAPAEGFDDEFTYDRPEEVIEAMQTAPALILDEFGLPDVTPNKESIVEQIVRYRHGHELPMLITTNQTSKGFAKAWGPTIASVVLARAHWIPVTGAFLRAPAAVWGREED